MIAFLQNKAIAILATLLCVSLLSNAGLYFALYFKDISLDSCKTSSSVATELAKLDIERYQKQIASYDSAIIDITQFYDFELKNIDDFKKDDNETECDSGYRLLRTFKY